MRLSITSSASTTQITGFCDDTTWMDIPYVKLIHEFVGYVMMGMAMFSNGLVAPNLAVGQESMSRVRDNMTDQMWRAFQQNSWYR